MCGKAQDRQVGADRNKIARLHFRRRQRHGFQHHTSAVQGKLDRHGRTVHQHGFAVVRPCHLVVPQPEIPLHVGARAVDQAGLRQRISVGQPGQIVWVCQRQDVIVHKRFAPQSRPVAGAIADVHVHDLAVEIGGVGGGVHPQVPVRVTGQEIGQTRPQPTHAKAGRYAQVQPVRCAGAAQVGLCVGQHPQRRSCGLSQQLALQRQAEHAACAAKQLDPQLLLQQLDLLADGRGRDGHFFGRAGQAAPTGDGLEVGQGVQVGRAAHGGRVSRCR